MTPLSERLSHVSWRLRTRIAGRRHQQLRDLCAAIPPTPMPPKERFEIVIAKYREDLSWATPYAENLTVYSKDPAETTDSRYQRLPNIGRETGTYLHHIIERYDTLAERTLFLQGAPFEHVMLPFHAYHVTNSSFLSGVNQLAVARTAHIWSTETKDLKSTRDTERSNRKWWRISAAVKRAFWQRYIGGPMPFFLRYGWGAQFSVSRERIHRSLPLEKAKALHALTQQETIELGGEILDNYQLCVLFETLWPYLFDAHHASDVLPGYWS